jgi:hypothetical protein
MSAFTLPTGWKITTRTRKSGKTAGRIDKYYYSPSGKRYRSIKQVKLVVEALPPPPPTDRVWFRDPATHRLVRVSALKSVQEIDLGPEIEEVFIKQSIRNLPRWGLLRACVFSVVSLAFCTLAVI